MVPSGLPTGTVSSGRDGSDATRDGGDTPDARARIAELERENEALRAAVEKQRRENERIVERYEQLLDRQQTESNGRPSVERDADDAADSGPLERLADLLRR